MEEEVEESEVGPKVFVDKQPVIVDMTVTDKNVEILKRMENFRPIRRKVVLEYIKVLERGETFAGLFVLNRIKDSRCTGGYRFVIIDGNHRLSAITEYIEQNPDAKIDLRIERWENLTHDVEKEVFIKHSTVHSIGQADKFYVRQKDCLVWRLIQEDRNFPCKVAIHSSPETALRVSSVLTGYISRNNSSIYKNDDWIESSFKLTEADFNSIKQWLGDMVIIFSKPTKGNHWFGRNPITSLAKIYYANVERIGRSELIKRLQRKVQNNGALYNELVHFKAGGGLKLLTSRIIDAANIGYTDVDKMLIGPGDVDYSNPVEVVRELILPK